MPQIDRVENTKIGELASQPSMEQAGSAVSSVHPQVDGSRLAQARTEGQQAISHRSLRTLGNVISSAKASYDALMNLWQTRLPSRPLMPRTFGTIIPPSQRSAEIDARMVEHEIKQLPRSRRREAAREMPLIIQQRINRGFEILRHIQSGTISTPASPDDVRDLMTFLMAKAMEKGDGFSEGAFSIEDPDQRLKNFLTSCPGVYHRRSSHIKDFQNSPQGGHFGIDLHLPYGNRTLLFGEMAGLGLPENRIFLKMEKHGCRLFNFAGNREERNIADRPLRLRHDIPQFLNHAMGYLRTLMRNISGGRLFANTSESRKERIPTDVANKFKSIVSRLQQEGKTELVNRLTSNNPLSSSQGLRTIFSNITTILIDPSVDDGTKSLLRELQSQLMFKYDHLDVRIGNEIVLDRDEIVEGSPGSADDEASTKRMARSILQEAITSLLEVSNPEELTANHIRNFFRLLSKAAITTDRKIDIGAHLYENALREILSYASEAQKEHLKNLISSPPFKKMAMAVRFKLMNPTEIEESAQAEQASARVVSRMSRILTGISETLNVEIPEDIPPQLNLSDIESELGFIETLSTNIGINVSSSSQAFSYIEHLGLKSLEEIRRHIGENIFVVGDPISSWFNPETVNHEAIESRILQALTEDLINNRETPRVPGLDDNAGLFDAFVVDFHRNTYSVNGEPFGGELSGSSSLEDIDKRLSELERFIHAVGGLDKAKHIARVAHQGAFGILDNALLEDEGFKPLLIDREVGFYPAPGETVGQRSITVDERGIHISFRLASQQYGGDYDLGRHRAIDFTIVNAGSDHPEIILDKWDVLFSASPRLQLQQ
jgi:hypothetical protein